MRVAALYDVHGNLPALEAVLAEIEREGVDCVVVGGDIVMGPMPAETLDALRGLEVETLFLRGNSDRYVLTGESGFAEDDVARERRAWAYEQLGEERRAFLEALPEHQVVSVDTLGPTLFCHGSPRSDEEIVTAVTSDERLREILAGVNERTVVCGHTHHQFDRRVDDKRMINAGSVGMPYEGRPGAYWALLGPDVELRRTQYDVEAAVEMFRAGGLPRPDDEPGVAELLAPRASAEVAELFEQHALELASAS